MFLDLQRALVQAVGFGLIAFFTTQPAPAAAVGINTLPHFVMPGDFAIGVEPELTFGDRAGVGINASYRHGINDLLNVYGTLGSGVGPRSFRAGAGAVLDFFPDAPGQPGMGVISQGLFSIYDNRGAMDLILAPYVHKGFRLGKNRQLEPFVAIPFGIGFNPGSYNGIFSVTLGLLFTPMEHLRVSTELGVGILGTQTYFSTGLTYFH